MTWRRTKDISAGRATNNMTPAIRLKGTKREILEKCDELLRDEDRTMKQLIANDL